METKNVKKTSLEETALAAIRSLIAYRTELDNEYFSQRRPDWNHRELFLERYRSITELVDTINNNYNPLDDECVTLL